MISYLKGKIIQKGHKSVVVLTSSGVGYKVFVTEAGLRSANKGDEVSFFVHLAVKEDSFELYGFKTQEELELFELLIGISGVGPKVGLSIVSLDAPEKISSVILNEDAKYITQVSGIGLKTAQKIVIELKDKIAKLSFEPENSGGGFDSEVIDALVALGYSPKDAREATKHISKDIKNTEDKVKEALRFLGKN